MKTYTVNVNCGTQTCATEPGQFCDHLGVTNFGVRAVCKLFQTTCGQDVVLKDKDGWLQRCQQCLDNVKGD